MELPPETGERKRAMRVGKCRLNERRPHHLKTGFMRFQIYLSIVLLIRNRSESFSQDILFQANTLNKECFCVIFTAQKFLLKNAE